MSNKQPKHVHPKILFINLDPAARDQLVAKGFNVQNGSYGTRYVAKGLQPERILVNSWLPNFTEQEIVAVDLSPSKDRWSYQTALAHCHRTDVAQAQGTINAASRLGAQLSRSATIGSTRIARCAGM